MAISNDRAATHKSAVFAGHLSNKGFLQEEAPPLPLRKQAMKHPKSNLCVDFIIEHSKAKSDAEGIRICKKYEDILFGHFENPDKLTDIEKKSDLNMMVAMCLFLHQPAFVSDYILQLCDDSAIIKHECYVTLATLENLGVAFEAKVHSHVWLDFLGAEDPAPALSYLAECKSFVPPEAALSSDNLLQGVLTRLIELMFKTDVSIKLKLKALKALNNFCEFITVQDCFKVLMGIQSKCSDDTILFSCCGQLPGLIDFVCGLIERCGDIAHRSENAEGLSFDSEDLKPLWNCGGCGGAASMSMATALCLDVAVHDFSSLQTSELGDFLIIETKIVKFMSTLRCINNFYKSSDSVLVFDEFTPDDLKLLVQSENIAYAAIQNIYGMFHIDRSNVGSIWSRVKLCKDVKFDGTAADGPPQSFGPDHTMRTQYAFTGLVVAACKHQGDMFNNYAYSQAGTDVDSDLGVYFEEGPVFNLDFASRADLLWITDLSCLDLSLTWLFAMLHASDVNIRACGLTALTDLISKYDIARKVKFINAVGEEYLEDPKLRLCISRLLAMREKLIQYLALITDYLLNLLEKDKLTDLDSIREALNFLLSYGGLVSTKDMAKLQESEGIAVDSSVLSNSGPVSGEGINEFQSIDCRLQHLLLRKAAESPEVAAEKGVASSSLDEELFYYSIRRHEYVRALTILSQKMYVLSIATIQRIAPTECSALFKAMKNDASNRMTFSEGPSRRTFTARNSVAAAWDGETGAAAALEALWTLPKPSTALADPDIEIDKNSPEIPRDIMKRLLDLWHVSVSHKHLMGTVNALSVTIIRYWEAQENNVERIVFLNKEENDLKIENFESSDACKGNVLSPDPKMSSSMSTASPSKVSPGSSLLPSTSSFSLASITNILNRYHVTLCTEEYLTIKCDTAGSMLYGLASGKVTVSSKVVDASVTKVYCNIRDSTVFTGAVGRESNTVSLNSLVIKEKYIRSTEKNGLFFITSQPGTSPEAEALLYECNLLQAKSKPPLQMLSECSASVLADDSTALSSGGEVRVSMVITFTFINTCVDRDISDLIADIPLPQCRDVTSCVTECLSKSKSYPKYDKAKRVLFVRIPKIRRSSDVVFKAQLVLDGVLAGMQRNSASSTDRVRGFYLSSALAHLGFTLSNSLEESFANCQYSGVKFELPSKSSVGAQTGNITRTLTSSTLIKSYSCMTCDVFVVTSSIADTLNRSASSHSGERGESAHAEEESAVDRLLQQAIGSERGSSGELEESSVGGGITVVTRNTIFKNVKSSGVPPPEKPEL